MPSFSAGPIGWLPIEECQRNSVHLLARYCFAGLTFISNVFSYLCDMRRVSVEQLWVTAADYLRRHGVAGISISLLAILLSFGPLTIPNLLSLMEVRWEIIEIASLVVIFFSALFMVFFWGAVLPSYSLRACSASHSLSFRQYFPTLSATLKVLTGAILIALPAIIMFIIGLGDMLIRIVSSGGKLYLEGTSMRIDNQVDVFIVGFGFMLLIGGCVFFFTYPYCVIDKGYGVFEGLLAAARLTGRHIGRVLRFFLGVLFINTIGPFVLIIMLISTLFGENSLQNFQDLFDDIGINIINLWPIVWGMGLLVTMPWTMIVMGEFYRSLTNQGSLIESTSLISIRLLYKSKDLAKHIGEDLIKSVFMERREVGEEKVSKGATENSKNLHTEVRSELPKEKVSGEATDDFKELLMIEWKDYGYV